MRRDRGFTLVELLVASAIALLAISMVTLVFLTQQRTFIALDLTRVASEGARDALLEMEPSLRRLGWGIDPRYGLDFRAYNCAAVPCRDRIDAPDEIVFVARNPGYRWIDNGPGCTTSGGCFTGNAWHASVAGTTVTVTANAGDTFTMGRLLQITCVNGTRATMARVAQTATAAAAGSLAITVMAAVVGNPYRENAWSGVGADPCYTSAAPPPNVFLVDRYRYSVQTFSGVPWLVLDTGLDLNGNGTTAENGGDLNDLIPIARGVEDIQVAYVFAPGTNFNFAASDAVNGNWIAADAPGTVEEPDPTVLAPQYATAIEDPIRYNRHPANVRAVRITLGIRSLQEDKSQPSAWTGDPLVLSENRNAQLASFGKLRRYTAATTVLIRAMESRSPFIF